MVYLKKGSYHENNKKNSCPYHCTRPLPCADGIDGWSGVINDNMVAPCGIDCDCVNPTYTTLVTGNPTYSIEVATATGCIIQYYDAMIMECNHCLARSVVRDYGKEFTHPTFIYGTENGITAYHCPRCSYYKY